MKAKTVFLAAAMACGTFAAKAQQDTAKLYPKIEQLFAVMDMEAACLQAANLTADQTIAGAPQLSGKKDEARAFFIKYMGYAACKNDLVKLYAKHYTIEEVETLTAFYKTSAGKKMAIAAAQIQVETSEKLRENLQAHAEELNRLVAPAGQ